LAAWLLVVGIVSCAVAQPVASPLAFEKHTVGPEPFFRPTITNVQIVDFDGDGQSEILACDVQADAVFWYRRSGDGSWREQKLADGLVAPAHATVVDLDQDGDNDVVVSVMGNLYPDDGMIGSLVLLENDGQFRFTKRVLLDGVRRVVDAQPGDFDGDGDIDLAVAVFGYTRGQVLWLENRGELKFLDHELLSAPGTIHVPVDDYDGDGDPDIVAVVSQDEEEVWAFQNRGDGQFARRRLWMTVNYDIGSAGLVKCDLDQDGDTDLLLPVGDNLEDSYCVPQPYHGCLWLENQGDWQFATHRIATFPGTYGAAAGDLDADGDTDIVLCSMVNHWDDADAPSIVWLENDGHQEFAQHPIAADPIMLITVDVGDLNGDGRLDLVAGGLHMYPPFDRLGRITSWTVGPQAASPPTVPKKQQATVEYTGPPLPNLQLVDPLTRADLQLVRDQLAAEVAAGRDTATQWLNLGNAYFAHGFFPEARECYTMSTQRDANSFLAGILRGVATQRMGEVPAAIELFQQVLRATPAEYQSWVWYEIGKCYLREQNTAAAEYAFLKAGDHSRALAELVKLRLRAGRPQQAVEPFRQLNRLQRGTVEVALLGAQLHAALGDATASQRFRDAAEYNSKLMPATPTAEMLAGVQAKFGAAKLSRRALDQLNQKQFDAAIETFQELLDAKWDKYATVLLSIAFVQNGQPETAIERLEAVIDEAGSFPLALKVLGDAYQAAGRTDGAARAWQQAAEVEPSAEVHQRLAQHFDTTGDATKATHHRALAQEAQGVANLRNAQREEAEKSLRAAVELDPKLPSSWFYLGECLRMKGESAAARDAYRKVLAINPNHGRALARLILVSE
jgi:tetratricopeptide (TPR) repeat protein